MKKSQIEDMTCNESTNGNQETAELIFSYSQDKLCQPCDEIKTSVIGLAFAFKIFKKAI